MDLSSKTLKRLLGDAGAGIDKSNGQDALYDVLKALADASLRNRVVDGLLGSAPTTASVQATGATGSATYRANFSAGRVIVDQTVKEFTSQADFALFATAPSIVPNGSSVVFAVVAVKSAAGAVTLQSVPGTVAVTGSQVPATKAQIQQAVGVGLHWVLIGNYTVNRTGDINTLTQSYDNSAADLGQNALVIE